MNKIVLKCTGCKAEYNLMKCGLLSSCPNMKNDNINHLLEKDISLTPLSKIIINAINIHDNPYRVFKEFYSVYHLANFLNINFNEILDSIDTALNKLREPAFKFTEFSTCSFHRNKQNIRFVYKNETNNITGSHKARHLMGNILYIEVLRKAGVIKNKPHLAIYSCGNAALAAAAIAKAACYKLKVFVPEDINFNVKKSLELFNADIAICKRNCGESGDPCYLRFHKALQTGYIPFSCSGPDNWANIEGGKSLAQEMFVQAKQAGQKIDSVIIQVGGGALASSAIRTIDDFHYTGFIKKSPKIFTVQTESAYPLVRAYYLLIKQIAADNNLECVLPECNNSFEQELLIYPITHKLQLKKIIHFIKENYNTTSIQSVLAEARLHKNKYMWPWEESPKSIAHGILDDITYDWMKIIEGMFKSGGFPITVSESLLIEANKLGKKITGIKVDPTGTSGFAGLLKLVDSGWITENKTPAVMFTGAER